MSYTKCMVITYLEMKCFLISCLKFSLEKKKEGNIGASVLIIPSYLKGIALEVSILAG